MLNFCDFIQVYVFTTNHHLNAIKMIVIPPLNFTSCKNICMVKLTMCYYSVVNCTCTLSAVKLVVNLT